MCGPVMAVLSAVSTLASVVQGQKQMSQQKKAASQAQANADRTASQAEQEINRKNAKSPNTAALTAANQQAAQAGNAGTMLTGPTGVDPTSLSLGKNTLLGV